MDIDSAIKRTKLVICATTRINFTDTVMSRKSQTQKNSHSLIVFVKKKVQKYIVVSHNRKKIHYCSGLGMWGED